MKKTLIAIAALTAAGAYAQSSVTISGLIDAGYVSQTLQTGVVSNSVQSTTASRVRFAGTQDLGGGLKANFNLEMQPNIADGTVDSTLFNRGAWAGLSSSTWGEIRLGRMGTNTMSAITVPDTNQGGAFFGFGGGGFLFNGMNGYSSAVGTQNASQGASMWFVANPTRGGYTTASSAAGATRYNRAVRYTTPALLNNTLTLGVTTALGGQTVDNSTKLATTTTTGNGGGSQGFDVTYAKGAFTSAFTYQKAFSEVGSDTTGSLTTVAANYNAGPVIVGGAYQIERAGGTGILFNSGKSVGLGVYVPYGAFTPYVKMGNHGYDTMGLNARIFNVGVTYNLSKTTLVYVDYARNSAGNTGYAISGTAAANNVVAQTTTAAPRIAVVGMQVSF